MESIKRDYTLEELAYYDFHFRFDICTPFIEFLNIELLRKHTGSDRKRFFVKISVYMSSITSNNITRYIPPFEGGKWDEEKIEILHRNFARYFLKSYISGFNTEDKEWWILSLANPENEEWWISSLANL